MLDYSYRQMGQQGHTRGAMTTLPMDIQSDDKLVIMIDYIIWS